MTLVRFVYMFVCQQDFSKIVYTIFVEFVEGARLYTGSDKLRCRSRRSPERYWYSFCTAYKDLSVGEKCDNVQATLKSRGSRVKL